MREDICNVIRNDIVHLKLKPGEPLNEIRLAKELQVSRTPIREALRRLASEGLVTVTPNVGARVSEINLRDFRELIEYRIILERGVAHLVAANLTEDDLRAMRHLQRGLPGRRNHTRAALAGRSGTTPAAPDLA